MKALLLAAGLAALPAGAEDRVFRDFLAHVAAHPGGDAAASFAAADYADPEALRHLPIGVFDSGIGGLTVLEALLSLDAVNNASLRPGADGVADLAGERFVYFGDQANMPYGNYPAAGGIDYLRELILKDAAFLLGRRRFDPATNTFRHDKPPVKAIVIACNTATAYGLDDLRALLAARGLPVVLVGVVEAGARGLQAKHREGAVGVLATVGTCASGVYPRVIGRTLGLAGRRVPAITQHGSSALAALIEGGSGPAQPSLAEGSALAVRALVENHRLSGARAPLGTVILGCTHYPLAQAEIEAGFARLRGDPQLGPWLAGSIAYVDPAEWTARELVQALAQARLRLHSGEPGLLPADQFYLSVPHPQRPELPLDAEGGLEPAFKHARLPGRLDREDTVNVPLDPAGLPPSARRLLESRLPQVWQRLQR